MRAALLSITLSAAACLLAGCENKPAGNTTPPPSANPGTTNPNAGKPTATDQSNSKTDVDITARIRSAIVDDDSLSTSAKNCTIVTKNGDVTLRGAVPSQAEKDAVEAHAKNVDGVKSVDNQLEIKQNP